MQKWYVLQPVEQALVLSCVEDNSAVIVMYSPRPCSLLPQSCTSGLLCCAPGAGHLLLHNASKVEQHYQQAGGSTICSRGGAPW